MEEDILAKPLTGLSVTASYTMQLMESRNTETKRISLFHRGA